MVTVITPLIIIRECGRRGIDQQKLLDVAGLPHHSIDNASSYIPVEKMYALWEDVMQLTADPMFAIRTAEDIPFGAYRALDYMLATSSSPKEGLAQSSRSFGLMNSAFVLSLRLRRDMAYLELHNPNGPQSLPRPYIEYILTNYLVRLRFVTQAHCKPVEVHVTYEKPSINACDYLFGTPVRFRQPINRLIFSRHQMEIPLPHADPELCELFSSYAQRKLHGSYGNDTLSEIQYALAHNLENGDVSLSTLARQLARSCRSLQRDIAAKGSTFRDLLDRVRRERALDLMRDRDLPVNEIATKLKFVDASAFCRAFQRWTGYSPRRYRNSLRKPNPF